MKWCIVVCLTFLCCTSGIAQDEEIEDTVTVVSLPEVAVERDSNDTSIDSNRIIGGSATTIERFPYTVQVLYNRRLACGGSLLTRRHVLSAAHCFFDGNEQLVPVSRYTVKAGTARLESGGSTRSVSSYIVHERYNNPIPRDNDIAVMVLSSRFSLGSSVALASILRQGEEVPDNALVIHVGWGRTNVNIPQAASVLQEVTIRTVPFNICFERYAYLSTLGREQFIITTNMICSGLLDIGGADACQGDSGGPLVYQGVVVGVTSWGYGCGEPMFPGVNAKVSAYTNWINHTITHNAGSLSSVTSLFLITISVLVSIILSSR